MAPASSPDYAGDVSAQEAWDLLASRTAAQLVDVRTLAEWSFVGLPDLSSLDRKVHCIEWQAFPDMAVNPGFAAQAVAAVTAAGADKTTPLLLLCRSGARSRAAAMALTAQGFSNAFNITDGFEGGLDPQRHRGRTGGWKAAGLPWRQS